MQMKRKLMGMKRVSCCKPRTNLLNKSKDFQKKAPNWKKHPRGWLSTECLKIWLSWKRSKTWAPKRFIRNKSLRLIYIAKQTIRLNSKESNKIWRGLSRAYKDWMMVLTWSWLILTNIEAPKKWYFWCSIPSGWLWQKLFIWSLWGKESNSCRWSTLMIGYFCSNGLQQLTRRAAQSLSGSTWEIHRTPSAQIKGSLRSQNSSFKNKQGQFFKATRIGFYYWSSQTQCLGSMTSESPRKWPQIQRSYQF